MILSCPLRGTKRLMQATTGRSSMSYRARIALASTSGEKRARSTPVRNKRIFSGPPTARSMKRAVKSLTRVMTDAARPMRRSAWRISGTRAHATSKPCVCTTTGLSTRVAKKFIGSTAPNATTSASRESSLIFLSSAPVGHATGRGQRTTSMSLSRSNAASPRNAGASTRTSASSPR